MNETRDDKPTIYTFVFRNLRFHFSRAFSRSRIPRHVLSRAFVGTTNGCNLTDDSSCSFAERLIKKNTIIITIIIIATK